MTVQMSVAVSAEQRLTLTNMVLVAILGASVDKVIAPNRRTNRGNIKMTPSLPQLRYYTILKRC
jgi:hypothetical protein